MQRGPGWVVAAAAVAGVLALLAAPLLVKPVASVEVNATVGRLVYARPNIIAFDSQGGALGSAYLVRSASFEPVNETSFNIGVVYYCYQTGLFGLCLGVVNVTIYGPGGVYLDSQAQLIFRVGTGLGRADYTFTGVNVSDVYAVVVYTS